jgi:hypothetical protein
LSGFIRVRKGDNIYKLTVFHLPSPVISPAPLPEPDVSEVVDQNPFLPSPLHRHSVNEIDDDSNTVSRTHSPPADPKKKDKNGKKKFKF